MIEGEGLKDAEKSCGTITMGYNCISVPICSRVHALSYSQRISLAGYFEDTYFKAVSREMVNVEV